MSTVQEIQDTFAKYKQTSIWQNMSQEQRSQKERQVQDKIRSLQESQNTEPTPVPQTTYGEPVEPSGPEAQRPTKALYDTFQLYKQTSIWQKKTPEQQKAKTDEVISRYRQLQEYEGTAETPDVKKIESQEIWKPYQPQEEGNIPDADAWNNWKPTPKEPAPVTLGSIGRALGKSIARAPGSLASTLVGAGGVAADIVGKGMQYLPMVDGIGETISQVGKDTINVANTLDAWNQHLLPTEQAMPKSLQEFSDMTAGQKALLAADQIPEQLGTMFLPGVTGAKFAQAAAVGAKGAKAAGVLKPLTGYLASKGPKAAQALGALTGSTIQSAAEIGKSQMQEAGDTNALATLIAAPIAGKLESLVPASAEWLSGAFKGASRKAFSEAMKSPLKFLGHFTKEVAKNGATESATELAQEAITKFATESAKGEKGLSMLDAASRAKNILNKEGLDGLIKAAKNDPTVGQLAMAAIMGGVAGGIFEGAGISVGGAKYLASPVRVYDNMVNAKTTEEKQKAADRLAKLSPLARQKAREEAAYRSIFELDDAETDEESVQEAFNVFREVGKNERDGYYANLAKTGWAPSAIHQERLQKFFEAETAGQPEGNQQAPESNQTSPTADQTAQSQPRPDQSGTTQNRVVDLINEINVEGSDEHQAYLRALEDAAEPDETTRRAKSNFGIDGDMDQANYNADELTRLFPPEDLISKPAKDISGTEIPGAGWAGKNTNIRAGDKSYAGHYAVVELDSLSTNKNMGTLQNRDRTRAASTAQVESIANNPDPDKLISADVFANDGPMIVGPDMVVESGNGRTMGLRSAYDKGTAEGYRQAVAKRAAEFGIPAENVLNMKKPALVRVRSENLDDHGRSEFVSQANAPRQLQRSPSEKAMTDGQAILPFLHQLETQNLASKSNGQFFTDFFQKVATPEEAGALTLPNGNVSQEGLNRVRNAIFAAAYGDPEILVSLTEDPDSRIKSILNGLQESVVDTARLTAESKTGAVHPVSINDILPGAAKKVADIRASGTDLEEYFLQGQFGKDGMQPAERILLGFFATQKSAQKIGALVKTFNDIVRSYGPPAQMAFPGMEQEAPTAESVLRQAISKEFPELNEAVDRWAQGPAALNPTFSKKRADSQKNQKLIQLLEQFGETADPQTAKTAQSLVDLINQIGGNQDVEFSKKSPKQSATISREELDQTAASIQSNLDRQHGIKVIVVESTKELSEKLKQDVPQSVEGALVGRNVYLVRENLPDTRRAIEVAGHEVIGHFGLKSLLKGEWGALVDDFALLGEKDQGVLSEIERAKRDYGNDKGMTRDRIIDEALARTAEKFAADPDSFSERAKAWFNDTLSRIQDSLRAIGFDIEFNARDLARTIRGAKTEVTATGAFNSRSLNKIEELISQIESEDPKTKDAKFSYAGMRADNGRVVEASRRLQNGEDPERIRKETGWFKGPYDGAMRLEIDDSKMSVNFDALADSEFSPENLKTTLGDVLNHPDLYAIYPELKDLPLLNAELDGAKGRYQPALKGREGLGALFVNKSKLDPESLKATLVHELQHVIQEIEGFAKGGSMDEFLRKYKKELRELEDQVGEINREMDFAYKSGNKDYYYELMNQRHGLVEKINSLSGPEDMGPYDRANNDYLNLAGEVEARDAAGRQRKSLAGRKKYAPFTDPQTGELKTPKEDAIVRFSYAGQRANRPQNIGSWKEAKARLDEGEDAETVRLETGWFVSPYDKMPRFELDDSKAKWLSKPKYNKDGRANIGYLGEMLKHEELFSAYPKLKDALVKINLEPELNISGAAHAPTLTTPAYIEVNAPDQDTAKEVLVHEFQHLIQHYEGFARGGSSNNFEPESEDEARKRAARSYSDIARSVFDKSSPEFQSAARLVNRTHNLNLGADEQSEEYYQARREFAEKFGKDAEEYLMNSDFADQAWRGEINYDARGKYISPLSPYDKYRSLAGEVEARDAAERTGLSSKERKLYPPFSTAEIDPEDAIVRFSKKNSENKLESLLNQIGPDAQPDKMSDLERILNEIPEERSRLEAAGSTWYLPTSDTVKFSKVSERLPSQLSFDMLVPEDQDLKQRQTAVDRVEKYFQTTKQIKVGSFKHNLTRVDRPEDAAKVLAPLAKDAREQGVILVLDAKNKPIGIIRHTSGGKSSTMFDASEAVGGAIRIPGAASFYIAHNHPTGITKPSNADRRVMESFNRNLKNTGLEYKGSIIIGYDSDTEKIRATLTEPDGLNENEVVFTDIPGKRNTPAMGLEYENRKPLKPVSDPAAVEKYLAQNPPSGTTLILTDNANQPVAEIPMDTAELLKLRTGDINTGAGKILAAIDKGNATGIIAYIDKNPGRESHDIAENLERFSNDFNIRFLDAFMVTPSGKLQSMRSNGLIGDRTGYFSKKSDNIEPASNFSDEIPVREVEGHYFRQASLSDAVKAAKKWYEDNLSGTLITNAETGRQITFNRLGLHALHPKHGHIRQTLELVRHLPELVENARHLVSHPDRKNEPGLTEIHRFAVPVRMSGRTYGVKMTIKEFSDGNFYYDHSLTELKELKGSDLGSYPHSENAETKVNQNPTVNITELLRLVKPDSPTDPDVQFSKAYHGTPHRGIEKEGFRLNRIGTGEGNQAYGWGMYFAGDKEVAEHYRKKLSYREQVKQFRQELPDNASIDEVLEAAQNGDLPEATANVITALAADDWLGFDYPSQAITAAFKELDNYDASPALHEAVKKYSGQLYHAEIPDDTNLLDWDSPLENQPEHVRKSLEAEIDKFRNSEGAEGAYVSESATGEQIYKEMVFTYGSPRAASERLNSLGVPGLRYFDGNSRKEGSGSHNYVIWNESSMNEDVTPYYSKQNGSGGQPDPFDPDPEPMPTLTETTKTQGQKVMDVLAKAAGGLMGDTRSQADRKRPDFKRAQKSNPEADTDFELEYNNKNQSADEARKKEDSLILAHLDADKNLITGLIRKMTKPGDLQDWMLKKTARILADFQAAKPIERILFTVAENMAYDEKNNTLKASPGIRLYNADSGEYEYVPSKHAAAAEHFFNTLAPEWKQLMIDRAKENEEYRKNFENVVVPHAKAKTAIALLARLKQMKAPASELQGAEAEALDNINKIKDKIDPYEWQELRILLNGLSSIPSDQVEKFTIQLESIIKNAKGELKPPAALKAELKRLNSNRGHYGYAHHYFESEKAPSQGKSFDAFGRIPNGWIEEVPGTQKLRSGAEGNERNLLKADIAKSVKEIRAEASNNWMRQVEDQRGLLVDDWEDTPDDQMPEGYLTDGDKQERRSVIANFGQFRGRKIYLPVDVYDFYEQVREVGVEDPGMREFGDVVQMLDGVNNRINEAMLYHTGKFARDIIAAPFHMAEFLRDWSIKHPFESVLAVKALAKATVDAARPSNWQKNTPESFGEYSESLPFQNKGDKSSFLTRATDSIGAWFTSSIPVGSTIASALKELNLSGAGDLPMKRIMQSVGEQIADSRKLTGKARERFIYDMINDYAFVTQDLPAALAYLRGQRPTKNSRAWGAVMRLTIPFLGYSSRLAKQNLADPISKGVIPMAKRLIGKKDADANFLAELSEASRPFAWLVFKSFVAAGLGGLIPEEEEGLASKIQNAKGLDPLARTHGRILIGQDDDPEGGERWLSTKGMSHLQVADAISDAVNGKSSISDFSAEFLTIHPVMQTALSLVGVQSPYQADTPKMAMIGRTIAQAMLPQMTRLGPDLAKLFRAVGGSNTIPDAKKQTFFSSMFEQWGIPVGAVKVDRDGKLRTTKAGLEAFKLIGLNIREIPYEMISEAAEDEAKKLDHLVKRIETIQEYRDGDRDQDLTEREFIAKTLKTNRFTNLDEAVKDAVKELEERGLGILATVAKLREKGRPIADVRPSKDPFETKYDFEGKLERRMQRRLPKKNNKLEDLIRDVGNDSSRTTEEAMGILKRLLDDL